MRLSKGLLLAALCLCAGWPTSASAQVRPKILILFDTSGSMLQNSSNTWQGGDGSKLCTDTGQQSRIYQLKAALFDALQGMGATEVDFGLATFPMLVDATRTPYCAVGDGTCNSAGDCRPGESCSSAQYILGLCGAGNTCPSGQTCIFYGGQHVCVAHICVSPCESTPSCSGHYYTTNATLSELNAYSSCNASDGSDCRYGCKVSTHNASSQTSASCGDASAPCSAWYTEMKQEVLQVPFGTAPEEVMEHFDQLEDTDTIAPLVNREIRAGNGWWTPLGKSLFYAHGYFHKEVVPNIPAYEKPCTTLAVAFFTDGAETCNDTQSDPFYPTTWATNLNSNMGVVTHTVAIDTQSSLLQDIATYGKGSYYNVAGNTSALKQAFLDIIAKSLPPTEVCNGLDDDCDNATDEDFPLKGQPCDNGKIGLCYQTGTYVCKTDGTGVVCNAQDVTGTPETCNGIDDDCNGAVDDVALSCTQDSDCSSLGKASCVGGSCTCITCLPQPEVCNGKDDDCDGIVDEDFTPTPCGKDLGECKPGQTKCVNGKIVCDGGNGPVTEVCNGLDDDCDGIRDGMSESCYTFPTGCTWDAKTSQWACLGYCKPGLKTCTATQVGGQWTGVWSSCAGEIGPATEICNGLDDDCDGEVDEDVECPNGGKCINGVCTAPCGTGEFACPKGQICEDGWCVPDPCDPVACGATGGICKGGVCIDPCKNVTCGKYEECQKGVCVDTSCYNPKNKCPEGQKCIQGECKPDPCLSAECGDDQYCEDGQCIGICATMQCPEGQMCKVVQEGGKKVAKCVEDPCAGQQCGPGFVCKDGLCVEDPCNTVACNPGQICVDGECVSDPCETIHCPVGYTCEKGQCVDPRITKTDELLATGAGGIACNMGPHGQPPRALLLVFALALLIMVRKPRRD